MRLLYQFQVATCSSMLEALSCFYMPSIVGQCWVQENAVFTSLNINILVFWFTERKRYVGIKFPNVRKIPIFMVSGLTLKLVIVGASQIWVHDYHSSENKDMAGLFLGKCETSLWVRQPGMYSGPWNRGNISISVILQFIFMAARSSNLCPYKIECFCFLLLSFVCFVAWMMKYCPQECDR